MNMTRKRSPRKKRSEFGKHIDIMEWWIFSNTILGILLVTLPYVTSIPLQNEIQQNPAQDQNINNSSAFLLDSVSNEFKIDIHKNDPIKTILNELNIKRTLNQNSTVKNNNLRSDSVAENAGNNSNAVEIHIRLIDKKNPVNGAPLLNIDKYKYDIHPEISTKYETVYNNNFAGNFAISTTESEITTNIVDDPVTFTTDVITTTDEVVTENTYKSFADENEQFRNDFLGIPSTEKIDEEILQSTTFDSQFAVTTVPPQISKEKVIRNAVEKKEKNDKTRNIEVNNNNCLKNEKCRNSTGDVKVGDVLNNASSDFIEVNLKLPQISTENQTQVGSDSEENMVENFEMSSHKKIMLFKNHNKNLTKPFSKKEHHHTTKKYFPASENDKKQLKVGTFFMNTADSLSKTVYEIVTDKIINFETTTLTIDSETETTTEQFSDTTGTEKYEEIKIVQILKNKPTIIKDSVVKDNFENFTKIIDASAYNINATNKSENVTEKLKDSAKMTEETKIGTHVRNKSNSSARIIDNTSNSTNFKSDSKNITRINEGFKNISTPQPKHKNKTRNEKKHNSHEATTEEDYNSSYEMDDDDDDYFPNNKNKSMTEPLDMGPFTAFRDMAGSFMESLVERIIPQSIRDLMKRMQNQNTQLETIKLRSREENGGIGQFGRSLLKGLTQPLNQWMKGVRDYGSLDTNRTFFSDVASGVASVADTVGDSFKDRVKAIFPGTLWCGDGDMAKSAEVGLFFMTDSCCRRHDTCRLYIMSGDTKYGLTNTGLFTRSHCECDKAFYRCLKRTNSLVSSQIGVTYFSILGPQCFKREHPIVRCIRRTRLTGQKCEEYEVDHSQPKMWQWFDSETF